MFILLFAVTQMTLKIFAIPARRRCVSDQQPKR